MKNITLLLASVSLLIISCSTPVYFPPHLHDVQKKEVVGLSFDDTWYKLIEYLYIEHNIPAKLDKENGLISLDVASLYPLQINNSCDCGVKAFKVMDQKNNHNIDTLYALATNKRLISTQLNILVKKIADNKTSIEINAMFDYKPPFIIYQGVVYTIDDFYKVWCTSTGELEKEIYTFVQQK